MLVDRRKLLLKNFFNQRYQFLAQQRRFGQKFFPLDDDSAAAVIKVIVDGSGGFVVRRR